MSSPQDRQPERPTEAPTELAQLPAGVALAVETFASAAHTRRIENICKAYDTLKSSANGYGIQHLLPLVDKLIGRSSLALIVSAYSHEKCFMCANGSIPCEACAEDDSDSQSICSNCGCTGYAPCEFCGGTGWVGNDVIPHELQRSVWRHRLKHTHTVLEKYARVYTRPVLDALARQPVEDDRRRLAIMESIRLASKMHTLSQSSVVTDPAHFKHLVTAEQKIRACLQVLAWE